MIHNDWWFGIKARLAGLFVCCLYVVTGFSADIQKLSFATPSSLHLPGNKIQCMFQDRRGFLWIGSTMGLYRFDGYDTKAFKNDLFNNIHCICEDDLNRLWIGTKGAVKVLHEDTDEIETFFLGRGGNPNVTAMVVVNKTVIIGTDWGIYRYDGDRRRFIRTVIPDGKGGELRPSITTVLKDRNGNIWFGTWSDGLWRWDLKTNRMIRYPRLNLQNSVHYLFQDSRGTIWAIGWNSGLYRLHFSKDLTQMTFDAYPCVTGNQSSLGDNMAYCITEDVNTKTIWVGSRSGVSVTDRDNPGHFTNYYPGSATTPLPYGEIDAMIIDKEGGMWFGALGGGVFYNNSRRLFCRNLSVGDGQSQSSALSVVSICPGDKGTLWVGVENKALYLYNMSTGKSVSYQQLPEFAGLTIPMVNGIVRNPVSGEMYFSSNGGVTVYRKGHKVRLLTPENTPYVIDHHVTSLFMDHKGNLFVGSWFGLGIRFTDGTFTRIHSLKTTDGKQLTNFEVRAILLDSHGVLWLSTYHGLLKIEGNLRNAASLKVSVCDISDEMIKSPNPLCLYEDRKGRVWVGSDAGLSCYNPSTGQFDNMTEDFHLPGHVVYSIQEDSKGDFWLGTNDGLMHLAKQKSGILARVYTREDGLSGNYFNVQAVASEGPLLLFGNNHGIVCVNTQDNDTGVKDEPVNVFVTGLNVNGRPVSVLPSEKRERIISCAPEFSEEITIPAAYDDFTIFFSALSYRNINQVRYAYRIEGLDKRWQYTDSYTHNAHYSQLPSGTYQFQLKAMNDDGTWSEVKSIRLHILPPFYATWWAYTFYILLLLAAGYRCFMFYRNRQTLQHTLNMHTTAVYNENTLPLQIERKEPETVKSISLSGVQDSTDPRPAEQEQESRPEHLEIPTPNMDDVQVKSANEEFLDKAVSVVKEHLKDENYSVDRFVSDMSMSKSAVYKRMKLLTGMNTSSFIKSIRLKAAIQIMKQNCEVRVSDLAYLVGFSDPKYFSACFKKEYGMTPSEYVERFLKK